MIEYCEQMIARYCGKKHCVLTGRGASALWLAYSLVHPETPGVLLPVMTCLSPMFSVKYSNRVPVFADVMDSDATIDPVKVGEILSERPKIGAVVAIHLYGHPADMRHLREICSEHGVMLIEDLAQAFGGEYEPGRPFGSEGDISIVSFGHTKIIDAGGGGGLLTDDDALAHEARLMAENLPDKPKDAEILGRLYREMYYLTWNSGRKYSRFFKMFDMFPEMFEPLYLFKATDNTASNILKAIDRLPEEVTRRRELGDFYFEALSNVEEIKFFKPSGSGIPWRFTFQVDADRRDPLLETVRKKGFDISSWYPSISEWTPEGRSQGKEQFPIANRLESEIVNLWVSEGYTAKKAKGVVEEIKNFLSTSKKEGTK